MSNDLGVTLQQLLNFNSNFNPNLLWELLHTLSFHLKDALKDPASWQQGPIFLICSSKIHFYSDGNVSLKRGSIGEFDDSLYVAPEYYNSDTKLSTPAATEQIYVYCLGMTIYSAAEFNCEEEVELPGELEEVLIGMVNEVAALRTSLTTVSQACQANIPMSKKSALKELIQSYLKKNAMEGTKRRLDLTTPLPPPPSTLPPPPSVATLPSNTSSNTSVASNTPKKLDLGRTVSAPASINQIKKASENVPTSSLDNEQNQESNGPSNRDVNPYEFEAEDANPYATSEILDYCKSDDRRKPNLTESEPASNDDGYSNADELDLVNRRLKTKSKTTSHPTLSNHPSLDEGYSNADDLDLQSRQPPRETDSKHSKHSAAVRDPSASSSEEPDNPYGTAKTRCQDNQCIAGRCTHTPSDLSYMYSTVQKIRGNQRPQRSSSSRVDGFRLDTTISVTSSESASHPIQLTMRQSGKPVIIQFPSNKRFQIPAERDNSIKSVFSTVIKRLTIEDASLFGLMHSPVKGVWEFIPPDHKLKVYAPDKWKSDAPTSPPVNMKLAVKFYPPSPHKFVNQVTRLQFFLNIRNLILEGTHEIPKEAAFDLAALSLQADLGDYYDRNNNQYFEPENYVPPEVMATVSYQYVSKEIPMLHSKLDDMSQNEAVMRYLQIASKLPDYGIHFFEVTERNPYEVEHNYIGICLQAVVLYEKPKEITRIRGQPHRFQWNQIANLSYKNKTFILDVCYNGRKNKNERRYNFETESTKISRIIMSLCADTHKFYIKLKNMLPPEAEDEPTFSVRDYTPSPRAVLTDSNIPEQSEILDTGMIQPQSKTLGRSESQTSTSKRPAPDSQLIQKYVCLKKARSAQSLGMTIVGGDGSQGIYVDKLATGGLAHLDGRIRRGDMLVAVNGAGLKYMSHREAVDLITNQPSRVELELVESTGSIPYDLTVDKSETDSISNNSIEVDPARVGINQLSKCHSAPVESSPGPWFTRLPGSSSNRLPGSSNSLPSNNNTSTLPESLQNRLAMQERYNLVRQPQVSTTPPFARGQSPGAPGYPHYPSQSSLNKASGGYKLVNPPLNDDDDTAPVTGTEERHRRLTRGSSEQIPPRDGRDQSDNGSLCSDYSPHPMVHNRSGLESDSSIVKSEGEKTETSNSSSQKTPITRDPFSRIFTVYLAKQRGSLGMSIRVDKGVTYVRDVFPNGPAAASGMVQQGDAVLSVNGVDLSDRTNQEVVNVLQQAPNNVTVVMSWGTGTQTSKVSDSNRTGMQFRVTLNRAGSGFGFTTRNTYMGNESFIRIKTILHGGSASLNGCLEEGDILLTVEGYSLENVNDRILSNILSSVDSPAQFVVYRPDTIRTFNPRKYETGRILPVTVRRSEDLLEFDLCPGYPYYRNMAEKSNLLQNDRLLRVGSVCCQGIKSSKLQSIIKESSVVETQIFRPCHPSDNNEQSVGRVDKKLDEMNLSDSGSIIDQLMDKAETIILHKKEQGLGFSLLGQHDGKRIVHGVTVKTVLQVGAAFEEGRLKSGDLIIMVNGRSMVGITQSRALSTIRKSSGEVVLTVVPGHLRKPDEMSATERRLIGHFERATDM